jgi:hypothetical protein
VNVPPGDEKWHCDRYSFFLTRCEDRVAVNKTVIIGSFRRRSAVLFLEVLLNGQIMLESIFMYHAPGGINQSKKMAMVFELKNGYWINK